MSRDTEVLAQFACRGEAVVRGESSIKDRLAQRVVNTSCETTSAPLKVDKQVHDESINWTGQLSQFWLSTQPLKSVESSMLPPLWESAGVYDEEQRSVDEFWNGI